MDHLTTLVTSKIFADTFSVKHIADITGSLSAYGLLDSDRPGELHPGSAANLLYFIATCKDGKELDQHLPDNSKGLLISKVISLIASRIESNKPDGLDIRNLKRVNIAKCYICLEYDTETITIGNLNKHSNITSLSGDWFREFYISFYDTLYESQKPK